MLLSRKSLDILKPPPLPPPEPPRGQRRPRVITFRVSVEERWFLRNEAGKKHTTVSALVREVALANIGQDPVVGNIVGGGQGDRQA
jgi:hypothetical protein